MRQETGIQIEVCCGSVQDVFNAKAGGADRVELNSALFFGGLTPSAGAVYEAKKAGIEVLAMVRPREGGFCYSDTEFAAMCADARLLLDAGADGLVFGILHADGALDYERCARLRDLAGEHPAVFHRAIDLMGGRWRETIDRLCALRFTRILTSGQAVTAWEGRETLRQMREYAAGRIEILPGGSVRAHNVRALLDYTGCTQAHTSGSAECRDDTVLLAPHIRFTGEAPPAQNCYKTVDPAAITATIRAARG